MNRVHKNTDISDEEKRLLQEFFKENESLLSVDDLRYYTEKTEPEVIKKVVECFERDIKEINHNNENNENNSNSSKKGDWDHDEQ